MEDILITIPAHNEEKSIGFLVEGLLSRGAHVLVIDDGSTDNTAEIAANKGAMMIKNSERVGVTQSISKAVSFAKREGYSSVVTMDGDGQHLIEDAFCIAKNIGQFDVVLGSRFSGSLSGIPSQKLASNSLGANLMSLAIGEKCHDASCGLRGFKVDAYPNSSVHLPCYAYPFLVLSNAFLERKKVKWCDVRAVYDPSQLLYTRKVEMRALIEVMLLASFAHRIALENMRCLIDGDCDFSVQIGDDNYFCFAIPERDGYIVQCDERLCRFDFSSEDRVISIGKLS